MFFNALKVQKYLVSDASFYRNHELFHACAGGVRGSEDLSAQNESHRTFVSYGAGIFVAYAAFFKTAESVCHAVSVELP